MHQATVHDIVSNADTIINLKNPCNGFADWGQPVSSSSVETEKAIRGSFSGKKKKSKKSKALESSDSILNIPVAESVNTGRLNNALPEDRNSDPIAVIKENNSKGVDQRLSSAGPSDAEHALAVPEAVAPADIGKEGSALSVTKNNARYVGSVSEATTEPTQESQIQFRVCAGNLMSASPWFNRILKKNGWMESTCNTEVRMFHISAEDWDEDAFAILMNVFHLRNRRVPRSITLEMLAKIAVLADYYECEESIQLFVDVWVADLREKTPVPHTYCRNLILWLWISWAL
jgi:hypothetical protein